MTAFRNISVVSFWIAVLFCFQASAQPPQTVSFEKLPGLQQQEERPVLVFLTADWCTYCERMKETFLQRKQISEYLGREFYYVEFDIENREDVVLFGKKYSFRPTGANTGIHELAEAIGTIDGIVSTPTIVVMNSRFEILYQYSGFMDYDQIWNLLERTVQLFNPQTAQTEAAGYPPN